MLDSARHPGPVVLWLVALSLAVAAAFWQRHTGTPDTVQGVVVIAGQSVPYQLPGQAVAGEHLRVDVAAAPEVTGTLRWRLGTNDPFQGLTMLRDGEVLVGLLPALRAGGQLQYQFVLAGPFGLARIPADEPVQIRYQGEASPVVVAAYFGLAFLALLVGLRAGLASLVARGEARPLAWTAATLVVGAGLALGPLVQRALFGTLWSGWPLGANPVDNQALVAGLAWAVAAVTMISASGAADRFARTVVVFAAVILLGVALLPRSLHATRATSPATTAVVVR